MRHRRSILSSFCLLLLFLLSSKAFSQSGQILPAKRSLLADSAGARVKQIPVPLHPGGIHVAIEKTRLPGDTLQGPVRSPEPNYQWARFNFSSTKWEWFARKPGTYGGQVVVASIQSNGSVLVDFRGFRKLRATDGSGKRLKTYYAISSPTSDIEELTWMKPSELNDHDLLFDEPPLDWETWALWQKVVVERSAPAANFKDGAVICIQLLNVADWIDKGDDSDRDPQ